MTTGNLEHITDQIHASKRALDHYLTSVNYTTDMSKHFADDCDRLLELAKSLCTGDNIYWPSPFNYKDSILSPNYMDAIVNLDKMILVLSLYNQENK